MEAAIAWMTEHWAELLAVLFAVDKVAALIVALTPTPADDRWHAKIYQWVIEPLAGIWGRRAKELPGERVIKRLARDAGAHTAARKANTLKRAADRAENLIRSKLGWVVLIAAAGWALGGCTPAIIVQTNHARRLEADKGPGQCNVVNLRPHQPTDLSLEAEVGALKPSLSAGTAETPPAGDDVGPSGQKSPDGRDGSTDEPDAPEGDTGGTGDEDAGEDGEDAPEG